ncbi:LBF_2804 family protein [Pinibacter soli]|uniref:TerB family tellurite resistance protein n=1 Tax=Pinibacter soli TaxID=3044211 RepID=A0ABT6R9U0_9BACT|nr:hypothetical protein [Pinibacter soli]MDI3319315.1 hypothetical protein [Pinibacter soli]
MRKVYGLFYNILPIKNVQTDDELYLLNDAEVALIKKRERTAIIAAAFFGAMGVVLLVIPQHLFPQFFPATNITLFGKTFALPLVFWIYSIVLVYIELLLLTLLNIWVAHEIAVATGFLNYSNKSAEHKRNLMLDIGLEKKNKQVLQYGIDPLQKANRQVILVWNLMFMLKATLSNFVFKLFIQRVFGRYIIQMVKDMAGIPIFAFWNAYGTHVILNKAKIIIMGQNFIEGISQSIYKVQPETHEFKTILYDTLQFIAISKRDFHENHFLLAKNLFALYNITAKDAHLLTDDYLDRVKSLEAKEKNIVLLLIITGFLLDGKISFREKQTIREMNRLGVFVETERNISKWAHDFLYGKGLDELLTKYLGEEYKANVA